MTWVDAQNTCGTALERSETALQRSGTALERSGTALERLWNALEQLWNALEQFWNALERLWNHPLERSGTLPGASLERATPPPLLHRASEGGHASEASPCL